MKRRLDEHDVSAAMNRVPTIVGIDVRYAVGAFALFISIAPCVEFTNWRGSTLLFWLGLLFVACGALGWYFGRDPLRLPGVLLALRHRRHYSVLRRANK